MNELFLTFDVEDFINDESTFALKKVLNILERNKLKGLFFLTGHMAEKLSKHKSVLGVLQRHEIGYHSTTHSVRPTIFEYTDIPSYEEALQVAMEREVSHISPLTGEREGKGGILFLRQLFPNKRIVAFRAPGLCWSPPHLEAISRLGLRFDFSTDLSEEPVNYKKTTFYPYPFLIDDPKFTTYSHLVRLIFTKKTSVIGLHPHLITNKAFWDRAFWHGNPQKLLPVEKKSAQEIKRLFLKFEILFKLIGSLEKAGRVHVNPPLLESKITLQPTRQIIVRSYRKSFSWAKRFFGYRPDFQSRHYSCFFETDDPFRTTNPPKIAENDGFHHFSVPKIQGTMKERSLELRARGKNVH